MAFANSPVAMKRRAARSRTLRSLVMPCSFHRSLVQTDVQIGCRASGEACQIDVWSLSARILSGLDIESDDPAIREDKLTGPASGWHEPRYAAPGRFQEPGDPAYAGKPTIRHARISFRPW